jgi:predicted MFS family arabinose efflux permease
LTGIPLERINANFGMIAAASALFSAPLAGVLIAWLGAVNVLWFNVGTFIVSMLLIALLVPRLERMEMSGASFMGDVLAGLAYVRNQDFVRTLILGALGINFLFAPLFGIAIPWFANQELQSVRSLGIMLGGQGLGALAGAYLYGRLAATVRRRTLLVTSLTLLSVPLFPLAFVSSVWPATALLILIGLASGMVNPMIMTFVQRTTPGAYLGRVMGLINAGAMVAQPLGLVLGGMFLGLVGFSPMVFAIAVLVTTVSVVLLQSHALRQLDNPIPVEAPTTTG